MKRSARLGLAVVFVALLATPALIRRFGDRAAPAAGAGGDARARATVSSSTESSRAAGIDFVHEAPTLDAEARAHHAAGRVDGRGGRRRRLRCATACPISTSPTAGGIAEPPLPQPRRRHVRGRRRAVRRRGPQQRETGVSMGAVFGDYDNDGFEDLFLYRWGRPELFHNDGGQQFHARDRRAPGCRPGPTSTPPSGSTTIATAGSISSSAATTPSTSISGSSPTRRSCRRASSTRTTAAASTCFRNLGDGRFEEVSAKVGLSIDALGARRRGRRSARHRLSRPVHRQRLRRLGAVHQRGRHASARSAARRASATRRRAA